MLGAKSHVALSIAVHSYYCVFSILCCRIQITVQVDTSHVSVLLTCSNRYLGSLHTRHQGYRCFGRPGLLVAAAGNSADNNVIVNVEALADSALLAGAFRVACWHCKRCSIWVWCVVYAPEHGAKGLNAKTTASGATYGQG